MRFFRILLLGVVSILLFCNASYPQLASSPWPMFQYNQKHIGKSPYSGPALPVLHWSYHFFTGHTQGSPSIGGDGRIYTAGGGNDPSISQTDLNRMYCMNADGAIKWSYSTPYWDIYNHSFIDSSPAISSGGSVYFGCKGGAERSFLAALDSSGGLQWSYRTADGIYSSSNLGANGEIYFQAMDQERPHLDHNLYALNSNGTLGWSYWKLSWSYREVEWSYWKGGSRSSPAVWDGDGSIVTDGVFLFNSTGSLRWSYDGVGGNHSPSFGNSGRVYAGSMDSNSNAYAFNSNGTLAWSYMTMAGAYCDTVTADESAGRVYAGSIMVEGVNTPVPQRLYALNTAGSLVWSYRMEDAQGSMLMGPIALDSAGRIYDGSVNNKLYAWNSNGALIWSYRTVTGQYGPSLQGGPALGSDGKLYISDGAGVFYAIGPTPTPSLKLQAKVYLEGPYLGGSPPVMRTPECIPTASPYEDAREVDDLPANVTDWIYIELRRTSDGETVAARSAFLRNDGVLMDDDGTTVVKIAYPTNGDYYVVIRHRNHLDVMSSDPISLSITPCPTQNPTPCQTPCPCQPYDFTDSQDKAYGTNPMKDLGDGNYGLIAGDVVELFGLVDDADHQKIWDDRALSGYRISDLNLNCVVESDDRVLVSNNEGRYSGVPGDYSTPTPTETPTETPTITPTPTETPSPTPT